MADLRQRVCESCKIWVHAISQNLYQDRDKLQHAHQALHFLQPV